MHIWRIDKWKKYYEGINVRSGLWLRFDREVDPEVKRACKEFCCWLRKKYYFPVRVPVYIRNKYKVKAFDGEMVKAFFGYYQERSHEPYVSVAVGDYSRVLNKWGKDNALSSILGSIAHELTHYFQWINGLELTERGEERQANTYVDYIMDEYKETHDHP